MEASSMFYQVLVSEFIAPVFPRVQFLRYLEDNQTASANRKRS
jgi:hypothetical protein